MGGAALHRPRLCSGSLYTKTNNPTLCVFLCLLLRAPLRRR